MPAIDESTNSVNRIEDVPKGVTHDDDDDDSGLKVIWDSQEVIDPLVSIIYPVYNGLPYVKEAVLSGLNQATAHSYELVIVDDGSTDESPAFLASIKEPNVRVLRQKNGGIAAALNTGLANVRGQFVTWVSADCRLRSNFVEILANLMLSYPEAAFVSGEFANIDENGDVMDKKALAKLANLRKVVLRWSGVGAFLWRKSVSDQTGWFNSVLNGCEDWDMWTRMLEVQPASPHTTVAVYEYRRHSEQMYEVMKANTKLNAAEERMIEGLIAREGGRIDLHTWYPTLKMCINRNRAMAMANYDLAYQITIATHPDSIRRALLEDVIVYLEEAIRYDQNMYEAYYSLATEYAYAGQWGMVEQTLDRVPDSGRTAAWAARQRKDDLESLLASRKVPQRDKLKYINPETLIKTEELLIRESLWEKTYAEVPEQVLGRGGVTLRLAVIPSDPLDAYVAKGRGHTLQDYYNPLGFFDEVYVFSPKEDRERSEWGMRIIPTKEEELVQRIKQYDIHVVRAYGGYWACDMAVAGKVQDVPVVCSVHDTKDAFCCHESVPKADQVWPVSRAVADKMLEIGVQRDQMWLFTNRVDTELFRPMDLTTPNMIQRKMEFDQKYPGKYRILHVGRKAEQKNWDTLLRAMALLGDDFTLIMTGKGGEDPLRNMMDELGISHRVHLIQTVENTELPYLLNLADAHCTPSRWEGFGINFVEALAAGAAVVTSNIAPMNEYITHEVSGLLVDDYEDPTALAAALTRAITDRDLHAKLKANAPHAAHPFAKSTVDRWEAEMYRLALTPIAHKWT